MLGEVTLDPARTHFLGKIPRAEYLRVLQVSAAHVYLTYPFVLSWSLLEAMACGTCVVTSDTEPVREVIQHGRNGMLVDFFDVRSVAGKVLGAVEAGSNARAFGLEARRQVQRYGRIGGQFGYDRMIGLRRMEKHVRNEELEI